MAGGIDLGFGWDKSKINLDSTKVKRKILTQEGMNQIIQDILSSDQGLASLATGENLSGGYGASTKALLSQKLVTDIAGTLANIIAPDVEETDSVQRQDTKKAGLTGKLGTVICTELNRQGLLSNDLYKHPKAVEHFESLPEKTLRGYHVWAGPLVPYLRSHPNISRLVNPIAVARYSMIASGKWNLVGALTIYVAQPICYLIGTVLEIGESRGYFQRTA